MSTNIFEALREDHEIQRSLADRILETSGKSQKRAQLFKKLKKQLQDHADCEERYFYNPLIEYDKTQDLARHGIAEHHEMDELIEELENTDMSSPGWLATFKKLHHEIFHHLDDEEHGIFQVAGKVLKNDKKISLADDYRKMMKNK